MNEPRPRQDDLRSIEHTGLSPAPDLEWLLPRLLATVRCVSDELRPQARLAATLGLDHSLERDYGLDSLARVELIARIDRDLGLTLGEAALTEAETPRDLLRFILRTGGPAADTASSVEPRDTQHPPVAGAAPESYPPDAVQTLVEVFEWHLQRHPDRVLITLYESGDQSVDLRYADLYRDALALAAGLRALGLDRGDKVAIMLPTGREFFAAFFGALVAGAVPVPLYPPARPSQLEDHLKRITGIMRNAQARVLVTVERAKPLAHLLRAQVETLQTVSTVADLSLVDSPAAPAELAASDVAFLQYTSGSTGDPKGVILTHANLLANLRAMWRASGVSNTDTFVSWLPLYHDMGLIGACLGALVLGFHLVLMSPLAFLARPARWLETIHRHRGTVSATPNFAYELCLSKLSDADLAGLDLSSWRLAFNGAEPVSPDTLERFAARFSPCGFKREALMPVYGLAESSVGLAFPPVGRGPWIDRVDRATLARDGVALCAVLAAPGLAWRRRAARALTRAAIGLIGLPVRVDGLDRLPSGRPLIVVANHASYVDSILLGAVLPAEFSFAAKRELADVPLIGRALRRLGIAFVERFDAAQGIEDTRALEARVRAGESFAFFPEGTLRRASGLQPFKLGAFVIATETGTPLVPVTLNGTRSLLRDGAWLPQRGDVRVTISAAIPPASPGWDHALEQRDAARKAMAASLAEATLDA
jgi:1-acyl-sn-glycerol-3-phosphate acyltransferase